MQCIQPRLATSPINEEECAIICAVHKATGFPLDDLSFVLRHFLPHLNRDSIYRALKVEDLNRRPPKPTVRPRKGQGRFSALCHKAANSVDDSGFVVVVDPVTGIAEKHQFVVFEIA